MGEREGERGNQKSRRTKGQKGATEAKMAEFSREEQLRKGSPKRVHGSGQSMPAWRTPKKRRLRDTGRT